MRYCELGVGWVGGWRIFFYLLSGERSSPFTLVDERVFPPVGTHPGLHGLIHYHCSAFLCVSLNIGFDLEGGWVGC